ncbi:MAG: hypothetical protein ACXW2U_06710 [Telluria sp.]
MIANARNLGMLAMLGAMVCATLWLLARPDALAARIDAIRAPAAADRIACARPAYRILVLGQSNAANHGPAPADGRKRMPVIADGSCYLSSAPLPGATGDGDSIWPHMADELGYQVGGRPLAFAVLAVENTTIADWTGEGPVRRRLVRELAALRKSALSVDLVLWQQGEADARDGTSRTKYTAGLLELEQILAGQGVRAPLLVAQSTYCPGSYGAAVRGGVRDAAAKSSRILVGPDTDELTGAMRLGCHFSGPGLDLAARQWATAVRALSQGTGPDMQAAERYALP